jgi:hypothetical protein
VSDMGDQPLGAEREPELGPRPGREPERRWPARRLAALGATLVALAAAAVGIGIGVGSGGGAPGQPPIGGAGPASSTPAAPIATTSPRSLTHADGTHAGPLSGFLVAMPNGYLPGQDVAPFGSEGDVPAADFGAVLTDVFGGGEGLLGVTRMAVLSAAAADSSGQLLVLLEQAAPAAAQVDYLSLYEFASTWPGATATAAVAGYPTAKCFTGAGSPGNASHGAELPTGWCVALSTDVVALVSETSVSAVDGGALDRVVAGQLARLKPETGA